MRSAELISRGSRFSWSRKFTRKDILEFAEISKDKGIHHVNKDEKLMVHGLLISTLPTKLGGELNFIAGSMEFSFLRPVYEEETISCVGEILKMTERETKIIIEFSFVCTNEKGEKVMTGKSKGIILKE